MTIDRHLALTKPTGRAKQRRAPRPFVLARRAHPSEKLENTNEATELEQSNGLRPTIEPTKSPVEPTKTTLEPTLEPIEPTNHERPRPPETPHK